MAHECSCSQWMDADRSHLHCIMNDVSVTHAQSLETAAAADPARHPWNVLADFIDSLVDAEARQAVQKLVDWDRKLQVLVWRIPDSCAVISNCTMHGVKSAVGISRTWYVLHFRKRRRWRPPLWSRVAW